MMKLPRQNQNNKQDSAYRDSDTAVETTRVDSASQKKVIMNTPEVLDLITRADRMISTSAERLQVVHDS